MGDKEIRFVLPLALGTSLRRLSAPADLAPSREEAPPRFAAACRDPFLHARHCGGNIQGRSVAYAVSSRNRTFCDRLR